MFKKLFIKLTLAFALTLQISSPAYAAGFDPIGQDIDIFLANPAFSASRPNVLILVDNSSNWSSAFANEKSALMNVVSSLDSRFNVGLMMFSETGSPNSNVDGGYVRFAVRQMTDTNKTALNSVVGGLDRVTDKANLAKFSLLMAEAYRYFAGGPADAGTNKSKTDYTGNTAHLPASVSSSQNALSSFAGSTYNSPIVEACQKNFIIVLSNGPGGENSSDLTRVQTLLSTLVGTSPPATISITPSGEQSLWADELARYMANNDCNSQIPGVQKVTSYTLDVDPETTGQGPDHTAMLKSMAANGKGAYFAVSSAGGGAQIIDALNKIFNEVQAVNSAFVSATLPVSVNVRGTNINQVYIGLFRPDGEKLPRWVGNMKLYKLGLNSATDDLFTADANGTNIFNATTGFVTSSASSFWTTGSTFWSFNSPYTATDVGRASDNPDGDIVEKGGTAQRLRTTYATSQAARRVFTCTGTCTANAALSATPFDTSNASITAGVLGTYRTKAASSLTSVGTLATATVPTHTFANGDIVTITSASPPSYNGDFVISAVDTILGTFQYTLPSSSAGNLANVNKTSNGLTTGNLITVSGAVPPGYNVTDAPLTKVDGNNATYLLSGTVTLSATGGTVTVKKDVTTLAQTGNVVTATIPSHGYANMQSITISGATPAGANGTFPVSAIVDLDQVRYTNNNAGAPSSTIAYATIANHPFSTGNSVTVAGATPSAYNGTYTITKIDANTISYTIGTPQTGLATGTITLAITGSVPVTSITHPTSGGPAARNVGTVTTAQAHGFTTGQTVTIAGATPAGYNGANSITVGTSTTFTYSGALSALVTPAVGTITASGSRNYSVSSLGTFTVAGGSIKSSTAFTGATISAQNIAVGSIRAGRKTDADTTDRDNLINWVRGTDNATDENSNASSTDVRASIHGDVLHSKPQVVNYNRDGTENDVYVYYGANDGAFRSVKGGFATGGGNENWSFVASEFFGQLKRLRDNSEIIGPGSPKAYFFDGPISVYTNDVNRDGKLRAADGDKVYVYMSMRRGGRFIYALDVSDPDEPKFMWKKGCPNINNNVGCDAGYAELGQTWAEPQVGFVRASADPMLFVAGGYDPTPEDIQPCLITANTSAAVTASLGGVATYTAAGTCSTVGATATTVNRTMGRGIFVINALTGAVFWRAGPDGAASKQVSGMDYAMPADLFVLNRDGDNTRTITGRENIGRGFVDRIYAADTGGSVWRADIDPALTSDWAVRKVASISGAALTAKRKFLSKVDVVAGSDPSGGFDAVLIGAGDREHPFDATVSNEIYMFKDRVQTVPVIGATAAATITTTDLYNVTSNDIQQTTGVTQTASQNALNAAQGWRLVLGVGEKVTTNVVTVAGESFFNTNQPSASASVDLGTCESNLGIARLYNIRFDDATAARDVNGTTTLTTSDRSQVKAGGGFAPPPVQVVVKIDGKLKEAVVTFPVPTTVSGPPRDARLRTYWQKKLD